MVNAINTTDVIDSIDFNDFKSVSWWFWFEITYEKMILILI